MKIVIIEDEKLTARDLKRTILAAEPDIEIAALLHSVEEAIDYFKKNDDTDLIFSDIQLGDGLSFDIFEKMNNPVPVIFCTAHNTYFAEAFKAAGIDYVLKPFTMDAIEKALLKYQNLEKRFSKNKEDYKGLLGLLEAKLNPRKSAVIVHQRGKIIPLDAADIAILYIDNGGTYAFTFEQGKFLVNDSLEDLEKSFGPSFFRANRQYLVNRKAIKDASHFFNRKIIINLSVPFKGQVLVGKLKTAAFIEWLAQN
jgi:two-component system, LytTR family, response regulator LytT